MRLRATRKLFTEEIWNPLEIAAVPVFVFGKKEELRLTPAELSVYCVACLDCENPKNNCRFSRSLSDLQKTTGFSYRNTVVEALSGLVAKNFLRPLGERKPGSNKPQSYELLYPVTGDSLALEVSDKRQLQSLRSILHHAGLGYFNVPTEVLRQMKDRSSAALALFIAADRCVNVARIRDIEIRSTQLRTLTGQDHKTLKRSMQEIHERWLMIGFTDSTNRNVFVNLIDPTTGELLDAIEMEQKEADEADREKRINEATANREYSPEQILAWAMWALSDKDPKPGTGGNFLFTCPECRNRTSRKKKFAVNPFKGFYGAFACFECKTSGSFHNVVTTRCGFFDGLTKLQGIGREHPELFAAATKLLRERTPDGEYVGDGAGLLARVS